MHSSPRGSNRAPRPPEAPRIPAVRDLHGCRDTDNYAWMRDHDSPALREYLAAERAYYDAESAGLAELTEQLYGEAAARTPTQADDSVSWPLRGYRYWHRTPAGAEGRQLLRCRRDGTGGEELLLDENALGAADGYLEIGVAEVSPDDTLLAWSADTTGAEIYELRFTEIAAGTPLPEVIGRSYPGGAWSADSARFFYLVPDALNRPHQVWRHTLRSDPAADVLVYEETDARYELTLELSRSGELILITAASRDTTEVRFIPARDPLRIPVLVEPRRRGTEYRADHAADPDGGPGELLIVTDDGVAEFTLKRAPVGAPGRANWVPAGCPAVAPARADTRLERCDVLAGHLLLTLRRAGTHLLAIASRDGQHVRYVRPDLTAGGLAVAHAADYQADSVLIAEESLIEPPRWSQLDLGTGERRVLKQAAVPNYDAGPLSHPADQRGGG